MESKKKMLFIFNPFSGKAQIKSKLFEIIDVFVKGGFSGYLMRKTVMRQKNIKNRKKIKKRG